MSFSQQGRDLGIFKNQCNTIDVLQSSSLMIFFFFFFFFCCCCCFERKQPGLIISDGNGAEMEWIVFTPKICSDIPTSTSVYTWDTSTSQFCKSQKAITKRVAHIQGTNQPPFSGKMVTDSFVFHQFRVGIPCSRDTQNPCVHVLYQRATGNGLHTEPVTRLFAKQTLFQIPVKETIAVSPDSCTPVVLPAQVQFSTSPMNRQIWLASLAFYWWDTP